MLSVLLGTLSGCLCVTTQGAWTDQELKEYLEPKPNPLSIDVHGRCVTDRGMSYLSNKISITSLSLSNTRISDAGLGQLQNLINVEHLSLSNTKVTDMHTGSMRAYRHVSSTKAGKARRTNTIPSIGQ